MTMKKLLSYYQKELSYLSQHGKAFAHQFPKIARRLGMAEGKSEDPHVERIIESFALLTAQIHQRLDEDMQEVTLGLMHNLAPQLIRGFPSACIVQLQPDLKTSGMTSSKTLAAGLLLASKPVEGSTCHFRTCYPVNIQPLTLDRVDLGLDQEDMYWSLQMHFSVWPGASLNGDRLRLFLHGPRTHVNVLYSLMSSELKSLSIMQDGRYELLPVVDVKSVGFAMDETLFNHDALIGPTHSLLHDFALFAQKFHFIDLPLPQQLLTASGNVFTLQLVFNRCALVRQLASFAELVGADFFRLNCTPAINLFSRRAEPIALNQENAEYTVIADVRAQETVHVWSVDAVEIQQTLDHTTYTLPVYPLLGLKQSCVDTDNSLLWQSGQREMMLDSLATTSTWIAFSDRKGSRLQPRGDVALLGVTCTNGDLPTRILNGDPCGDFDADLPLAGITITALTRPTSPQASPGQGSARWRLISQLTLNHSLLGGEDGCRVLKESLALYNINSNPVMTNLIAMIADLHVSAVNTRLKPSDPHSLARGVEITLTFARQAEHETEILLWCRFLDHFLGLYAPVNSFSRLITLIDHVEDSRRVWPIRTGRLTWI